MPNDFDALFSDAVEEPQQPTSLPPKKRKRGRPATGKRSDDGWISRAFYIQESTDIDIEMELARLRREGIKMDKSELVDSCLRAWLAWRKGKHPSNCLDNISPRRKGE